jgi:hypothetical protein
MFYANKDKRKELSDLSKKVFGTRSKWHYFVRERGYSIDLIETQMKALEVEIDKQVEELSTGVRPASPRGFRRPNRATRRLHGIR